MKRDIDKEPLTAEQVHKLFVFSTVMALYGVGLTLRPDLLELFADSFYAAYANVNMETVDRYFQRQSKVEDEMLKELANMDCAGSA